MKTKRHYLYILIFSVALIMQSCYNTEKKCADFKNGKFTSETEVNGKLFTSTFERNDSILTETYNNETDNYHIRWINDCEYILKNVKPKNIAERKGIHIKILNTSKDSYFFEYSYVGESNKQKGKATKIN